MLYPWGMMMVVFTPTHLGILCPLWRHMDPSVLGHVGTCLGDVQDILGACMAHSSMCSAHVMLTLGMGPCMEGNGEV